jgi:pimeloyl-ACP methyl ester carboxylesterase
MKPSHSEFLSLRGRRMHVRCWEDYPSAPLLVMLHGWGDMSATWQFVVDSLAQGWRVLAPDWRGFGLSQLNSDSYWFPDYVADLDALLEYYSPNAPVRLVAHSMGGNVACLYAGLRPERVAGLVNLEGLGLPGRSPAEAPAQYAKWLLHTRDDQQKGFRSYPDYAALAARLQNDNPRLSSEQAAFLAMHLGIEKTGDNGELEIHLAIDPCHRWPSPVPYRLEEAMAIWRQVTAPVLWVVAEESYVIKKIFDVTSADYRQRVACFQQLREVMLPDAGHNMQHDQPQKVAKWIDKFFMRGAAAP